MKARTKVGVAAVALLAGAVVVGCGGSTIDPGDGGGADSGPDTSGPYACGTNTCGTGELCIHPCCGGAPPPCEPFLDDAGTCPPGTHAGNCQFPSSGGSGCVMDPCTPDPPYCTPAGPIQTQCNPLQNPSTSRDCYLMCM